MVVGCEYPPSAPVVNLLHRIIRGLMHAGHLNFEVFFYFFVESSFACYKNQPVAIAYRPAAGGTRSQLLALPYEPRSKKKFLFL